MNKISKYVKELSVLNKNQKLKDLGLLVFESSDINLERENQNTLDIETKFPTNNFENMLVDSIQSSKNLVVKISTDPSELFLNQLSSLSQKGYILNNGLQKIDFSNSDINLLFVVSDHQLQEISDPNFMSYFGPINRIK